MKNGVLFICFNAFIIFSNCQSESTIEYLDDSTAYNLGIDQLKQSILFPEIPRTVPYNKKNQLYYAKKILKDSIVILNNFEPFYKPINQIDWSENPYSNETWQLYYQNLFFVSILNHAYQESKQPEFHQKAKKYIANYINTHPDLTKKTSKYSWYDHSCAFRTLHVLQTVSAELQLKKPNINFVQLAFDHISKNVKFMKNSENYFFNNHSLMMDRSLLYFSNTLHFEAALSSKLKEIPSKRALANFDKIIDDSGLAKEHSISYHFLNHDLYKTIFDLIGNENIEISVLSKYLKMNDMLLQLVKPDLSFPLWGDSQAYKLNPVIINKFGNDNRLQKLLTQYKLKSCVSFESNIGTLRTNTNDKSYLAFFANYNSLVHKHRDDLSFVFQTFGIDIFTDQGYYGYEKKYRPALISAFAHNTVIANNKDYTLGRKGQFSKITGYSINNEAEIIKGTHNFYDSIILNRSICFLHPNVLVIKDSGASKDLKSLSQIFNFGKKAISAEVKQGKTYVKFPKDISVSIESINKNDNLEIKDFYHSSRNYKIETINQLSIKSNSKNIVSIIKLSSPKYKDPVSNVSFMHATLHYEKGGKKHKIRL